MPNNPFDMMQSMLRTGATPESVLNRLMQTDPRAAQIQRMTAGKSREEIYRMVCNMCQERGTTPQEVARSLGLKIK